MTGDDRQNADGRQETPPIEYGETDVEEMAVDELREEFKELSQLMAYDYAPHLYDWHEDAHQRQLSVWDELKERSDVEEPECPDCGARNWGQSPGDPKHCRECLRQVFREPELREEIDDAWDAILGGEQA